MKRWHFWNKTTRSSQNLILDDESFMLKLLVRMLMNAVSSREVLCWLMQVLCQFAVRGCRHDL